MSRLDSAGANAKRVGKTLLLALVVSAAGAAAGGFVPFVGGVGALLGIGVAHFAWGLLGGPRSRYVFAALAGTLAGGLVVFADYAVLALAGVGNNIVLVGAAVGGLLALLGRYLGLDLRAGLTREI